MLETYKRGELMMLAILFAAAAHRAMVAPIYPRETTLAEKAAIREAVTEDFKDPAAAQFRWPPIARPDLYCGQVNGKNSYGAYVGYRMFSVRLLRIDGRVSAMLKRINDDESLDATEDAQLCSKPS